MLRGFLRGLRLGVLDLLEDLAHARAQQLARHGVGVVITPPGTGGLARIDVVEVCHGSIVRSPGAAVNGLG